MKIKCSLYFVILLITTVSCTQKEKDATLINLDTVKVESKPLNDYFETEEIVCLDLKDREYLSRIDKIVKTKKNYVLLNKFEHNALFLFGLDGKFLKELKSTDFEQYNANQFYDVLYDKDSNQIELLTDTGVFHLTTDDLSYSSKQPIDIIATRFCKDKDFYQFKTSAQSGLTITSSDFNFKNKITYFPENNTMPFYQMSSLNSFTNFDNEIRFFRNFDNTIYTIENENLIPKWKIDFNEEELTNQEKIEIKNPQEVYQIRDKSLLHKFYFETKDLMYLSFFKNENYTVCLVDKKNKKLTCFDVVNSDNNLTDEAYFPFIMNTTDDGNFLAVKNLEGDNDKSCDSDFIIYELKFKQLK